MSGFLLKDRPGVEFDTCWEKRQVFDLGNGLQANYLGLPDLISAKLAAGRHIDLADADNLKVALERRTREQKPESPSPTTEQASEQKIRRGRRPKM